MIAADRTAAYLDAAIKEKLYSTPERLRFRMDELFGEVDFRNKKVLDIGGGTGLYSFYAAARGARKVLCLEPEADGSTPGVVEKIRRLKQLLSSANVEFKPLTLQDFKPQGERFDVVLLHSSINHLDETACIHLLEDRKFRTTYQDLFAKLFALSNEGASLIICDCSRYNIFPLLGLRNPFAPTIEWHKHQAPRVWAELLESVGFANPRISWRAFNRLGRWGTALLANPLAAYFLTSSFCLRMDRPAVGAAALGERHSVKVG
jgi:SAM-dependent methyltransferase